MITNKEKIIIVDDEKIILTSYKKELECSGNYEVFTASNGEEALEIIKKMFPAIAYIDLTMPEMDGFELSRQIKIVAPGVEIVPISGHPGKISHYQEVFTKNGNIPQVLQKPLSDNELVELTKSILNKKRS